MQPPPNTPLRDLITPGCRVAVADGFGMPVSALAELSDAARAAGEVKLVLGWFPVAVDNLDPSAFTDVRTTMAGYGMRKLVDSGAVRYIPARLQTVTKLVRHHLKPDVLLASVRRGPQGWQFTTEVSWMRAALNAGAIVAAIEQANHPVCDGGPPIPDEQIRLVGSSSNPPQECNIWAPPKDIHHIIASHITPFIAEGSRLQFGPGPLTAGVLESLNVPVQIDTGIITDDVLKLEKRGLLRGQPIAPYLAGSPELHAWAHGKGMIYGLEVTHNQGRLGKGAPLVTINTALQVDLDGQVNVESVGGSAIAGIGGQPDFAFAGASAESDGLSILAVSTHSGKKPTLVEHLSAPVSTPSHDIDVIVTENGAADLRGLDRRERRAAIAALW